MTDEEIHERYHDMAEAGGELIMAALKISRRYQICAACLLNAAAEAAFKAIDCGELTHGVPGTDYNVEAEEHLQ